MEIEYISKDTIENFYNVNGIDVVIDNVYPSFAYTTYYLKLNTMPKIAVLKRLLGELEVYIGTSVKMEFKVASMTFKLVIKNRKRVYPTFFEYCNALKDKPTCMLLGVDEENKPIVYSIHDTKSMLIGGSAGGGKSVAMHNLICSLMCYSNDKQVRFAFIDLKQCELPRYDKLKRSVMNCATTYDKAIETLEYLNVLIDERYSYMREKGIRKASEKDFPTIVCFIDEYAMLTSINQDKVDKLVSRIASTGRACNIYVIVATQHAVNSTISNTIRANLQSRIGLRSTNIAQSNNIIGSRDCVDLLGYGDSYLSIDGVSGLIHSQFTFISDNDLDIMLGD